MKAFKRLFGADGEKKSAKPAKEPQISALEPAHDRSGGAQDNAPQKTAWIRSIAKDKSFVDIGGLWGTVNEQVTVASLAGARAVAMVDMQPLGGKWWAAFEERCAERGVAGYEMMQADICAPDAVQKIGRFDIVHCSGVLYHVSNPFALVRDLALIAREYVILGSMLIPSRVEFDREVLEIGLGQMIAAPLLAQGDSAQKRLLASHFSKLGLSVAGVNAPNPTYIDKTGRHRTGPWWMLFTAETMVAMCELHGLEVIDSFSARNGGQTLLCKVSKPQ